MTQLIDANLSHQSPIMIIGVIMPFQCITLRFAEFEKHTSHKYEQFRTLPYIYALFQIRYHCLLGISVVVFASLNNTYLAALSHFRSLLALPCGGSCEQNVGGSQTHVLSLHWYIQKMVERGMQHFHDKNVYFLFIILWSIFPKDPIHNDNTLSLV